MGVSPFQHEDMELFRLTDGVFNTFSRERAEQVVKQSAGWAPHQRQKIEGTVKVPVRPVNHILSQHCTGKTIHFMSIDIEGQNFDILKAIDFELYRPIVLCVERNASREEHDALLSPFGYEVCYSSNDNLIYVQKRG
jgi:hypothetical protein